MGNIKLFVDAHSFDKEYQGVRTFIKEIYSILLEQFPDLDIYFGCKNAERLQTEFPLAHKANIIQYKNSDFSRFLFDIPRIINEYQIEFSHFQYIVPFGKKRSKYIVTTHDILFNDFKSEFSLPYRYSRNFLFRRGIQAADIKTTVSDYSRQRIAYYYKTPADQIHVIHNGVSKNFGSRFLTSDEAANYIAEKYNIRNYILYVSRIEPRKNHLSLLKAYFNTRLFERGISIMFIGKESIPVREIREFTEAFKSQSSFVHWVNQVDQHDLEAFYKASRIFAYPSKAEGFGIPPLEAAVSKVPVLCSNKTAMSEYDFFKPYLFDPYDQQELETKLTNILNQPTETTQLENIARIVHQRYSWNKSAELLFDLIREARNENAP